MFEIENTVIDVHMAFSCTETKERKPKPSEAILQLLKEHPEGLAMNAIVQALRDNINTNSANIPQLLNQTAKYLRDTGRVELKGSYYHLLEEEE